LSTVAPVVRSPHVPFYRRLRVRQAVDGYLFAGPAILGLLIFTAGPILYSLYLSFSEYNIIQPPRLTGFANYARMLGEDELFRHSLVVTGYYSALSIPLTVAVGLLVAILMNQQVWGIAFFRTVWYLPTLVPAAAAAALWRWILHRDFGLLNNLLQQAGVVGPGWLIDPQWTVPSLVMVSIWTSVGGTMLIFLAGLQGVPTHLYEAAEIDGASAWRRFRDVTLPMMSPVIFFNVILSLIASFQVFTIVYLIFTPTGTQSAGPDNAALFYLVYLYRNAFQYFNVGYAAALSWILFLIIVSLTLLMFRLQNRWVYYEAGDAR